MDVLMQFKRHVQNILVTGGSGFIGSAFIRYLLTKVKNFQGKCVNLDLLTYAGNPENLKAVEKDPRYTFVHGNICDEKLVEEICQKYRIDTIIHLAAESHVDRSIHSPHDFIETNVLGTFHLLEVVRRHPNIHFHHVSTDEVYGCLGDEGYFTEETPYHPNSPYSASKASSDHFVRAYGTTYGISTCVSNCSNNYGPYQFPEKMIPVMVLNCLDKKPLPVYGEGKNVRDWLYVDDHAEALWMLLKNGKKGETYNIGGNAERKNIDVVKAIVKIIEEVKSEKGLDRLITFVKDRPGHDFRYAIDCSKIESELGWKPSHNFESGLKSTVKWYIDHKEWVDNIRNGDYLKWLDLNYAKR